MMAKTFDRNKDVVTREVIISILEYIKPAIGRYIRENASEAITAESAENSKYAERLGTAAGYATYTSLTEALNNKASASHTHRPKDIIEGVNGDIFFTEIGTVTASDYKDKITAICDERGISSLYFIYTGTNIGDILKNGYIYSATISPWHLEQVSYRKSDIDAMINNVIDVTGVSLQECITSKIAAEREDGTYRLICKYAGSSRKDYIMIISHDGGTISQCIVDLTQVPIYVAARSLFNSNNWSEWTALDWGYYTKDETDEKFQTKEDTTASLKNYCMQIISVSQMTEPDRIYQYTGTDTPAGDIMVRTGKFYRIDNEGVITEVKLIDENTGKYVPVYEYETLEQCKIDAVGCYNIIAGSSAYMLYVSGPVNDAEQLFVGGGSMEYRTKKNGLWQPFSSHMYMTVSDISGSIPMSSYLSVKTTGNNTNITISRTGDPDDIILQYTADEVTWADYTYGEPIIIAEPSEIKIKIKANPTYINRDKDNYYRFAMSSDDETSRVTITGNIMRLVSTDENVTEIPSPYCFYRLFKGCDILTSVPSLPAMLLKEGCYEEMFSGCSEMSAAPLLPAPETAPRCYAGMFAESGIIAMPALTSSVITESCYERMFYQCRSLVKIIDTLPATTLAKNCYKSMFGNCSFIETAPSLPAVNLQEGCYAGIFEDCASLRRVEVLFQSFGAGNIFTTGWMKDVCSKGILQFYCPSALHAAGTIGEDEGSADRIPALWEVVNTDAPKPQS